MSEYKSVVTQIRDAVDSQYNRVWLLSQLTIGDKMIPVRRHLYYYGGIEHMEDRHTIMLEQLKESGDE